MLINPYKVGPPVTERNFYGRTEILSKVRQALISSNVVLLQGQRRIGKTSFLQQLPIFLSSATENNYPPLDSVIFDIQRYVKDTLPQFQEHLAKTIARSLQLSVPSLQEWEKNYTLFRDEWLPQVFERLDNKELVIIVDEFDNLGEEKENKATETLVPFLGELVKGERRLKWIFTIGRHSGKLPIEYDPIVSSGLQLRISFLSPVETEELIVKPALGMLTYESKAVERIYQLTHGHPHLTQALCSEIFALVVLDRDRNVATVEDVEAAIPDTLKTYESAIESIIRVPTLEEKVLVAAAQLTNEGKTASREDIRDLLLKNRVQLARDDLINNLDSLLEWELLIGNPQNIRVAVELVRVWLSQNIPLEPSREEKLDINSALAQSRFEFAEKARKAGQYQFAINDYKEALKYLPSHSDSLRGLAEAYRLTNKIGSRVETLQKLYLHNRGVLPELIEALEEDAKNSEEEENFALAAEQYKALIKLKSLEKWKLKLSYCLNIEALEEDAKKFEKAENFALAAEQYEALIKFQNLGKWKLKLLYCLIQESDIYLTKLIRLINRSDISVVDNQINKLQGKIHQLWQRIEKLVCNNKNSQYLLKIREEQKESIQEKILSLEQEVEMWEIFRENLRKYSYISLAGSTIATIVTNIFLYTVESDLSIIFLFLSLIFLGLSFFVFINEVSNDKYSKKRKIEKLNILKKTFEEF